MFRTVLAAAAVSVFALPALANECPSLQGQVDTAMKMMTVDKATMDKATALYDSGKAAHEAGDHAKSVADFKEALKMLGM